MAYDCCSSDESDDRQHLLAESLLDKKKREIVARSMAIIEKWLDKNLGKRERADQDSSEDESELQVRDLARKKQKRSPTKLHKEEEEEEPEVAEAEPGRRFACPYYKNSPQKYRTVKTCMGPGWNSVHRVKEHLYRSHTLPKHSCLRCFEVFKDVKKLKSHQRSEKGCKLRSDDVPDGFDEDIEARLRARSKPKSTEEEKWVAMFEILFPDTEVPGPYYEAVQEPSIESVQQEMVKIQDQEELRVFLRRELPKIARRMIEHEVEKHLKQLSDIMVAKSVEISESIHNQLFRTFAYHKEQVGAGPTGPDAESPTHAPRPPDQANPRQLEYPSLDSMDYNFLANMGGGFPFDTFMNPMSSDEYCTLSTNTGPTQDSAYYTSSEGFHGGLGNSGLQP